MERSPRHETRKGSQRIEKLTCGQLERPYPIKRKRSCCKNIRARNVAGCSRNGDENGRSSDPARTRLESGYPPSLARYARALARPAVALAKAGSRTLRVV